MKVVTATEAARRLGVTSRTIRLWIDKKILMGVHPVQSDGTERMNRFAIPESEVERLLKDRKKYDYSQDEQQQDVSALVARISTLEKEVDTLKKKLTTEPEKPVARPTSISRPAAPQRTPEPRSTMPETAQSASDGNIAARIFGPEMHGLTPKTVNEHINGGKIKATPRDASPGRDKWFFSPEEQRDAVKYWRENHTKGFHPCKDCPHQL